MKVKKYKGCNEDCEHCTYRDCLKPANQMKTDKYIKQALKASNNRSQSRMFTLELGRYGGSMPNISRKFLL